MTGLLLKVFIFSLLLSFVIKYGGPVLAIPVSATAALVGVMTPMLVMATVLGWRWYQYRHPI